jgi:hypothetical protein
MTRQSTGHSYDWEQERLNRVAEALRQSRLTFARVQGMKLRAADCPGRGCVGKFPFGPSRTCAEWRPIDNYLERRAGK